MPGFRAVFGREGLNPKPQALNPKRCQVFESCLDEKDGFALDEAMFEAKNACHACTLDGLLSVLEKAKVITVDDEGKMLVGGAGSSSTPRRLREASAAGARLKKRPRH